VATGDSSGVTTLLSRIPGTVQPQTGDAYARLGAPAGASLAADIAALPSASAVATAVWASTTRTLSAFAFSPVAASISGITFPANFAALAITGGTGYVTATNGGSGSGLTNTDLTNIVTALRTAGYIPTGTAATVNDSSPTSSGFVGDNSLSTTNNFYAQQYVQFLSGALKGQVRLVTSYSTSRRFTFGGTTSTALDRAFSTAPANGDTFVVLGFGKP
jgi:hypothetical protein